MLNKIYEEQKQINRNLQRISDLLLMTLLAWLGVKSKERNDEKGKKLCLIGVYLTAISQGMLLITDICEIIKKTKSEE